MQEPRHILVNRWRMTTVDPLRTIAVGHRGVRLYILNVCQIERRASGARSGKRHKRHDQHHQAHTQLIAMTLRYGAKTSIRDRPLSTHSCHWRKAANGQWGRRASLFKTPSTLALLFVLSKLFRCDSSFEARSSYRQYWLQLFFVTETQSIEKRNPFLQDFGQRPGPA